MLLDSDGTVITDTKDLLECWADLSDLLGQSHSLESLQESEGKVNDYLLASYDECDDVLNTEFNVEENTTNILNRDKLEALMVSHPSSLVQSSKPGFARFKITSTRAYS